MATRTPLTAAERQYIQQRKQAGAKLCQIADELHCSYATVCKWWQRLRRWLRLVQGWCWRGSPDAGRGSPAWG